MPECGITVELPQLWFPAVHVIFSPLQAIPLWSRGAKRSESTATLSPCPSAAAVVFDVVFQLIIKPFSASESASRERGGLTRCGVCA